MSDVDPINNNDYGDDEYDLHIQVDAALDQLYNDISQERQRVDELTAKVEELYAILSGMRVMDRLTKLEQAAPHGD